MDVWTYVLISTTMYNFIFILLIIIVYFYFYLYFFFFFFSQVDVNWWIAGVCSFIHYTYIHTYIHTMPINLIFFYLFLLSGVFFFHAYFMFILMLSSWSQINKYYKLYREWKKATFCLSTWHKKRIHIHYVHIYIHSYIQRYVKCLFTAFVEKKRDTNWNWKLFLSILWWCSFNINFQTQHTYIIGHYNPSVRIIDLASH